ncbi:hypothetical protein NIZ24_23460 (plasmid) [Escherichia albertii]|nr:MULTISPECIES: hypothetical protein [unclassified Escherichia]MCW9904175.1 hypothetical protein [Escherichia coli]UUK76377.1 hypothetical protein NIZ24_23460 [Escherichia albertii]
MCSLLLRSISAGWCG